MAVRTYARSRVLSTRIARIYALRPRQVTSDIVCSWNNRFYYLTVGVWPIPGADAPLFTRYTRIRVYSCTPCNFLLSLFLSPFSLSSLLLLHFPRLLFPGNLMYSTLYCPTGPACGRTSSLRICILLNVVNLSKRGPLCAGSRAILQAGNVCGILQRVPGRQSTRETGRGYLLRCYSERIDGLECT